MPVWTVFICCSAVFSLLLSRRFQKKEKNNDFNEWLVFICHVRPIDIDFRHFQKMLLEPTQRPTHSHHSHPYVLLIIITNHHHLLRHCVRFNWSNKTIITLSGTWLKLISHFKIKKQTTETKINPFFNVFLCPKKNPFIHINSSRSKIWENSSILLTSMKYVHIYGWFNYSICVHKNPFRNRMKPLSFDMRQNFGIKWDGINSLFHSKSHFGIG